MNPTLHLDSEILGRLPPRKRAVLKLRTGCLPLTEEEMRRVLPGKREEAGKVQPRSLRDVAALFGVSKERIRQLEARSLQVLGLLTEGQNGSQPTGRLG
jgi:DNA-directed RNA polymerase sigma subunit (sigma70/sigma32)